MDELLPMKYKKYEKESINPFFKFVVEVAFS